MEDISSNIRPSSGRPIAIQMVQKEPTGSRTGGFGCAKNPAREGDQNNVFPKEITMNDPLQPNASVLVKLGSLIVHYQEAYSPTGHHLDKLAIAQLEADSSVREWIEEMTKRGFLPVKR
jgi:hypothetical protein